MSEILRAVSQEGKNKIVKVLIHRKNFIHFSEKLQAHVQSLSTDLVRTSQII